jgi:hypothetical protein
MKTCKLLLSTIGATMLLVAVAGPASARILSSSVQDFRVAYRIVSFTGAFGDIRCEIELEWYVHARTIAKLAGGIIGYIERAILGPCELGTATILRKRSPGIFAMAATRAPYPT